MNNNSGFKRIISGSIWGISSKIVDAGIKIFTIPILLNTYGEIDYGLFSLAISLNTYLRLMELGINIGAIKFYSAWIAENDLYKLNKFSQTSILFYGIIGFINGIILVMVGVYSNEIFNITEQKYFVFRTMCFILSATSIFNWISFVFTQILTASEDFSWLNQRQIFLSLLNLILIICVYLFQFDIVIYFLLFQIINFVFVFISLYRLKILKFNIFSLIQPKCYFKEFYSVFKYSLGLFSIGLFQYSSNYLRPIILGIYARDGISEITSFKILQTITALVAAIGSIFLQMLIPINSKNITNSEFDKIQKIIYSGTKYITIFLSMIVSLIILNSKEIIIIFVGERYTHLSIWLNIWSFTTLLALHHAPIASFVLNSEKLNSLLINTIIATIISLGLGILLAKSLGVGSVVIGYFFYVCIQIFYYYKFYRNKIILINYKRLFFTGLFYPILVSFSVLLVVSSLVDHYLYIPNDFLMICIRTIIFTISNSIAIYLSILKKEEILYLIRKIV